MSNSNPKQSQSSNQQEKPSQVETKPVVPERPEANVTQAQKSADNIKESRSGNEKNG